MKQMMSLKYNNFFAQNATTCYIFVTTPQGRQASISQILRIQRNVSILKPQYSHKEVLLTQLHLKKKATSLW